MALNPSVTTLSGLAADRPANPGFTGVIYFATDTAVTTVWDGAAWQAVGGSAGSGAPGATIRGDDGEQGEMGPPGAPGVAGAAGSAGTTGVQGPTGPAVFLLSDAEPAEIAPPGAPGATGLTGPSAITRISGASGAAGADITLQILTANSADVTTTALSAAVMSTTGVGAGTWRFRYLLFYQTAATTTGIAFGVNHTGTITKFRAVWRHPTTGTTAATGVGTGTTIANLGQLYEASTGSSANVIIGVAQAGVNTINTDVQVILEGIIVVTVSGTLELKIASEIAASAVRITTSSLLELTKIA